MPPKEGEALSPELLWDDGPGSKQPATILHTGTSGTSPPPRRYTLPKNACLPTHRGTCWPEQHGKLRNLAHYSHYLNTTHAKMHQEYNDHS